MREPCNQRTFHLVVFSCNCFNFDVHRYLRRCRVVSLAPCTPVQEIFVVRPYKFFKTCYLAAVRSLVPLVHAHTTEWSRVRRCCVVEIEITGHECSNDVACRQLSFFKERPTDDEWTYSGFLVVAGFFSTVKVSKVASLPTAVSFVLHFLPSFFLS